MNKKISYKSICHSHSNLDFAVVFMVNDGETKREAKIDTLPFSVAEISPVSCIPSCMYIDNRQTWQYGHCYENKNFICSGLFSCTFHSWRNQILIALRGAYFQKFKQPLSARSSYWSKHSEGVFRTKKWGPAALYRLLGRYYLWILFQFLIF